MQLAYIFLIVEKTSRTPNITKHINKTAKGVFFFFLLFWELVTRAKLTFLSVSGIWAQLWRIRQLQVILILFPHFLFWDAQLNAYGSASFASSEMMISLLSLENNVYL